METKKWYVGQQVWDKTVSDEAGEIVSTKSSILYPIKVKFGSQTVEYTLNGKLFQEAMPTLSTKPYEIKMEGFSQEVQEELPNKGQICWGRDTNQDSWAIGHFIKKSSTYFIVSTYNDTDESFSKYTQITTKNPYEDVSEIENTDREPKIGDMCFFWDDDNPKFVVFSELLDINEGSLHKYVIVKTAFKYCSLKNQLIK